MTRLKRQIYFFYKHNLTTELLLRLTFCDKRIMNLNWNSVVWVYAKGIVTFRDKRKNLNIYRHKRINKAETLRF